jgi:hypothetical protein
MAILVVQLRGQVGVGRLKFALQPARSGRGVPKERNRGVVELAKTFASALLPLTGS